MTKLSLFYKVAIGIGAIVLLGSLLWLALGLFPNPLAQKNPADWSVQVTDRHGRQLKNFLSPLETRRQVRPLTDFSPNLIEAILAAEDKRFYHHFGLDPLAMMRAAWLNFKHQRIVSGGSTITMQLARLSQGLSPGPRTMERKLKEIWWALLIERHNSKETILADYLNRAPCGNLTEGFPAASNFYLNKSVADLSLGEAAFLAGLPASPGALNPYKNPGPALERRSKILELIAQRGKADSEQISRAQKEPLDLSFAISPFKAPHFVSYLRNNFQGEPPPLLATTLDLELQSEIEKIVATTVEDWQDHGLSQAAVVVLSLPQREIHAWVGSADFWNITDGQNDGVLALRQPGSALKPFVYATAFDNGVITPATLLNDQAADYQVAGGSFSPTNYSETYHGFVSARLALASSLNLPAVKLASQTGLANILQKLRLLGLDSLRENAEHYGLSLALGGGEVNLLNLTTAYAALADGGRLRPFKTVLGQKTKDSSRIFSSGAAFLVTDILSDPQARVTGFGFDSVLETPYPSAVKTGTSKSFRDNWCVGYTSSFVVGVWAGNFASESMDQVSGVTGAGTIWREVADLLAAKRPSEPFTAPPDVKRHRTCPQSGLLAGPQCPNHLTEYFLVGKPLPKECPHDELGETPVSLVSPVLGLERNFGILRPKSGEIYGWDPTIAAQIQNINAHAQSLPGVTELVWSLNARELKREKVSGYARSTCLVPLSRGPAQLTIRGLADNGHTLYSHQVNYTVR